MLFFILFTCSNQIFAQYTPFSPDKMHDGRWSHELIKKHELQGCLTNIGNRDWTNYYIFYSPDKLVRISQLHWRKGSIQDVITTFQFIYNGDTISQIIPFKKENSTQHEFIISRIYNLNNELSYIFISEDSSRNHHNYSAYVVSLKKDSFEFVPFITYSKRYTNPDLIFKDLHYKLDVNSVKHQYITSTDTIFFEPDRSRTFDKQGNPEDLFFYAPDPYLKFDTASLRLSFESGACPNFDYDIRQPACRVGEAPFYILNSGAYVFRDTAFVMISDSSWHLPPLETLLDTIYKKVIHIGGEEIKVKSIFFYEYDYYGYLERRLKTVYKFADKVLEHYTDFRSDALSIGTAAIEPETHLMDDNSLLVVIKSKYRKGGRGYCAGCYFRTHEFYKIKDNTSELLLSFTFGDDGQNSYRFKNKNKQYSGGRFVLFDEGHEQYELHGNYVSGDFVWLSNSKMKMKIVHWSEDIEVYREYIINFITEDDVTYVDVKKGEIENE